MPNFKKPAEDVEAFQWAGRQGAMPDWARQIFRIDPQEDNDVLIISTRQGVIITRPGDWVIKGSNDEPYSVPHDEFAKTYEAVEG